MDPLTAIGVAASVAGLVALGAKMISLLSKVSSVDDAPDLAREVSTEMSDISAALRHIQEFLNGEMSVPFQRRHYILVEHVVATLTGCVAAYSELEAIVDNLGIGASVMRVYDRTKWALKENDIRDLLQRLQNHKISLNLMLTILQCTSNQEIHQSVARLCNLIEQAVLSNDNLSMRVSCLERSGSVGHNDVPEASIYNERDDNSDTATIQARLPTTYDALNLGDEQFTIRFDFDRDLMVSRVYQRAVSIPSDSHSESSLTESARRLAAFSIFSTQSLAEISNLSVYSLLICLGDISNSIWYIDTTARELLMKDNQYFVYIKTLTGKLITIPTSPEETNCRMKKKIHDKEGLPEDWFCLVLTSAGGRNVCRRISDSSKLSDYGVENGSTLHVLQKSRWGGLRMLSG